MACSLNTGPVLFVLPHNSLQSEFWGQKNKKLLKSNAHHNYISGLYNYKSWDSVSSVTQSHITTHMWLLCGLPGAGCGVCGGRPLLAVLLGRVVDSVAGQQGEDEVWGLGAEISLTLDLTRFSYATKLLVIQTCGEQRAVESYYRKCFVFKWQQRRSS